MRDSLGIFLDGAVPLCVMEIQSRGGPADADFERAREIGAMIAEGIDDKGADATATLIDGYFKRGREERHSVGALMARMAFALAVGSFVPGGTPPFLGRRWETK